MKEFNRNTASEGGAESELHAYAWAGDLQKVAELLASGADPDWQDSIGETALIGAAGWGNADVVRLLLDHGARHDFVVEGWTALHWAARADIATVQVLVAAGADVNAANHGGELAIDVAHRYGKGDIVRFLKTVGPQIASRR
ncbi:MAG: ankyrin repeat domain-containing protein [Paracoccaceae bacterium]